MKVSKVLADKKNNALQYIHLDETIRDASKKMHDHEVSALIVLEDKANPKSYVGIISERMVMRQAWNYENVLDQKVSQLMSRQLLIIKPEDDIIEVTDILSLCKVRNIPIWKDDTIIGMITPNDIIKSMHDDKQSKIYQMSDMSGSYGNKVY
ncbi:MAG: CBS domain-containing protein [Lentisphaerota bacterium]